MRAGEVDGTGRSVIAGSCTVHAGDEVATRQNDRRLVTDHSDIVRNRATWLVDAVHRDGALTVTGRNGTVTLPPEYVPNHVDLAYATTAAGAQGRTVDAGVLFLDGPTDVRNLYVAMSRGARTNEAFIATEGEDVAIDVFARSMVRDWIDQPARTRQAELAQQASHRFDLTPAAPEIEIGL